MLKICKDRMKTLKKRNDCMNKINLKYFICLICSSLLLYPTLNVFFFYGNIINNLDIRNVILILLPGIFAILTLGIFKWITEKDFELIQDNKVDENETTNSLEIKKNNRKKHVYFWGIALAYTLIFGIVSFGDIAVKEKAFELAQKDEIMKEKEQREVEKRILTILNNQ